jgi:hypothetical protein
MVANKRGKKFFQVTLELNGARGRATCHHEQRHCAARACGGSAKYQMGRLLSDIVSSGSESGIKPPLARQSEKHSLGLFARPARSHSLALMFCPSSIRRGQTRTIEVTAYNDYSHVESAWLIPLIGWVMADDLSESWLLFASFFEA